MKKLSFVLAFFSFLNSYSQIYNSISQVEYQENRIINSSKYCYNSTNSKIEVNGRGDTIMVYDFELLNNNFPPLLNYTKSFKNTPYYQNKWFSGSVFSEDKTLTKGIIAYNLEYSSLFFSEGSNQQAIELKPKEFVLNGKVFKKFRDVYGQAGDVYYEQLVHGEIEIFKQYYCSLKIRNNDGYRASLSGYDGEFEKENRFFTIFANKMTRIGKSFNAFGLFAPQAKEFAKKENLKLNRERDLIKIAQYINQLYAKSELAFN
jgi:hypothetical protein